VRSPCQVHARGGALTSGALAVEVVHIRREGHWRRVVDMPGKEEWSRAHRLGSAMMRWLGLVARRCLAVASGSGGWQRAPAVPTAAQRKGEDEERPNL
jgi:hypothetical protein